MLRPYPPTALRDPPRQSVPGVLRDQRIGVDLRLRNRHQHPKVLRGPRLELPALRVLAEANQILPPLPLTVELEQALAQDHVGSDSAERVPPGPRSSPHQPQQRQGIRAA